jgi:branched-chain amino acid aminotransferase
MTSAESLTSTAVAEAIGQTVNHSTNLAELDASKLKIKLTSFPRPIPEENSASVWSCGEVTDHMITCRWTSTTGWQTPELKRYTTLPIEPNASCLHYATQCFEGMKVYRGYDGKLRLYRPDRNTRRLVMSSARVALPTFDPDELEKLIKALLAVDGASKSLNLSAYHSLTSTGWLPKDRPGRFLYIRPAVIGDDPQIGVGLPKKALLFVFAAPWPDFSSASPPGVVKPSPGLKLLASKADSVRAWPGGFGFAKVGANYGPAFMAHGEAQAMGYNQILWLMGETAEVTEAGASNFFVIWRTPAGQLELVTAPLDDKIILDGVTRRGVIDLAVERLEKGSTDLESLKVVERKFTMHEIVEASKEGRLVEAFVSGTAVSVFATKYLIFADSSSVFHHTRIKNPLSIYRHRYPHGEWGQW